MQSFNDGKKIKIVNESQQKLILTYAMIKMKVQSTSPAESAVV
jgi:hypothetical protein